jgi:hypothetical protein
MSYVLQNALTIAICDSKRIAVIYEFIAKSIIIPIRHVSCYKASVITDQRIFIVYK